MDSETIRNTKEHLFQVIEDANKKLKDLRESCPHANTEKGIWSFREGAYFNAIICSDCGQLIKNLDLENFIIR